MADNGGPQTNLGSISFAVSQGSSTLEAIVVLNSAPTSDINITLGAAADTDPPATPVTFKPMVVAVKAGQKQSSPFSVVVGPSAAPGRVTITATDPNGNAASCPLYIFSSSSE